MKQALHRLFNRLWYERGSALLILLPLAWLTGWLVRRRRHQFLHGEKSVYRAPVPVIVVGNISVGGTGKTPLVVWLVAELQARGYRPGIVSRGYGGKAPHYPYLLQPSDTASVVGDEPLMLFQRTGVPVVVDPHRPAAVQALLEQTECDVVISDDGLQHYALGRSYEILVLDGSRGTGNGRLLPCGPLREPASRLQQVNAVVINGDRTHHSFSQLPSGLHFRMDIVAGAFHSLADDVSVDGQRVQQTRPLVAIAAIGNPQRFFDTLSGKGIQCECHAFPDHHVYTGQDMARFSSAHILTTEKDAVKLRTIPGVRGWYLPVEARLQPGLIDDIILSLEHFSQHHQHLY